MRSRPQRGALWLGQRRPGAQRRGLHCACAAAGHALGEPAAPAHANVVAPQTAYYADFSHVRAGRGFMLLGRVLAIVMAVLTLLLAWRQYDAVSAAVLGLIFDDLAALSAFVKLLIYIPLALAAAAIAALPGCGAAWGWARRCAA